MSFPLHVHGKVSRRFTGLVLGRVSSHPFAEREVRGDHVLLVDALDGDLRDYAGVLTPARPSADELAGVDVPVVHSLAYVDHLTDGDIVALNPTGYVRTLFSTRSQQNAIFATDRCNSWCLMCSQPPKPVDDSGRLAEHLRLIDLIDPSCPELGITGGEPTLLEDGFLRLIERCRDRLPRTALHVLTNGRRFAHGDFAERLAAIDHPDLVLGIPVYSAIDSEHDHVVQRRGAFDETVLGLHRLARHGVAVEIRVVVHRLTYRGLPLLAEFIYRHLTFACHVTFMGLEMMGFAVPNVDQLWIDPWDYRQELADAVLYLAAVGMNVSIYNHQLCVVPEALWGFCRASISDWKNDYLDGCDGCAVREHCGGFFTSSLRRRYSDHIAPVPEQRLKAPRQAHGSDDRPPRECCSSPY